MEEGFASEAIRHFLQGGFRVGEYPRRRARPGHLKTASSGKVNGSNVSAIAFTATFISVMIFISLSALSLAPTLTGQKLWLVSRAAAVTAYAILTVIVILGLILSHPRNKDSWHLHKHLFGWHMALVAVLFPLLAVHLIFAIMDPKSGVTLSDLPLPLHARYYPAAMTAGALGLYIVIAVAASAGLRKKFKRWLNVHRLSLIAWVFVWVHGVFGGTDVVQLKWVYVLSGLVIFVFSFWRYWVHPKRSKFIKQQENAS